MAEEFGASARQSPPSDQTAPIAQPWARPELSRMAMEHAQIGSDGPRPDNETAS